MRYFLVDTDNFGGDYPNESFLESSYGRVTLTKTERHAERAWIAGAVHSQGTACAKCAERQAFIDSAFVAHPNLDLDIEAARNVEGNAK